jgi:hypothetical protein
MRSDRAPLRAKQRKRVRSTMLFVFVALSLSVAVAQDFCGARCNDDVECGGGRCGLCRTLANSTRECVSGVPCGADCLSDAECTSACDVCLQGKCGGLPCRAPCESNAFCSVDCGTCRSTFPGGALICVDACFLECTTSADCGSPCSDCVEGKCVGDASFSAGEVAGIAIGSGVASILLSAAIGAIFYCCCLSEGDNGYGLLAALYITSCLAAICCLFVPIVVGLSIGLSPLCCT